MTTFTRKKLEEYAGDVTATDLQVVGSDNAGSPALSDDPEVLQSNNAYKQGLLNIKNNSSNDLELKEINSLFYIHNYHLNYLLQKGFTEWNSETTYSAGDIQRGVSTSTLYQSLTNNNLNNAVTDGANWQQLGDLSKLIEIVAASETVQGLVEKATQAEVDTGTDTARYITPATLQNKVATEGNLGITSIATQAETNTGTTNTKVVTPLKLQGKAATQVEADNEVIANKFITPNTLHNAVLGYDYIATSEVTNASEIIFTDLDLINYNDFILRISHITPANNGVDLRLRVSTDNGASYASGGTNYNYAIVGRHSDNGDITDQDSADSQIVFNDNGGGNQVGNGATDSLVGEICLYNLSSSTKTKLTRSCISYNTETAGRVATVQVVGSYLGSVLPVNALQLTFSTGNIATGKVNLYAIK